MKRVVITLSILVLLIAGIVSFLIYRTSKQISYINPQSSPIQKFITPTSVPDIPFTITSDVKGVSVDFSNTDFLKKKLRDLSFGATNGVVFYHKENGVNKNYVTVKNLIIHLTDQVQPINKYYYKGQNTPFQSVNFTYDANTEAFTIYLYFSPDILHNESLDRLNTRISYALLMSVYERNPNANSRLLTDQANDNNEAAFLKDIVFLPDKKFVVVTR